MVGSSIFATILIAGGALWAQEAALSAPPEPAVSASGTHSPGEVRHDASSGMDFCWIPAGTFTMGSPESEAGRFEDEVQHPVTLSRGFWLGRFPVTQGQWQAVMGSNPSFFMGAGSEAPVEAVSWDDCQRFISRLNGRNQGTYRLPTEAEWEYACRAGSPEDRYGPLDAIAWYDENSGGTSHPVGRKQPNAWGVCDMIGNVFQWCQDWLGAYPAGSLVDPAGPATGLRRVVRGGSWFYGAAIGRAANRASFVQVDHSSRLGLRILMLEP